MDFEFTQDQKALQSGIVDFLQKLPFDNAYWREKEEKGDWPIEFCTAMAEGGWLGALIPEEYGGAGMGLTEGCILIEEIGRHAGINATTAVHTSIFGPWPLMLHGSEELKQRILPRIAKGEFIAFAITEPDIGFDTTRVATSAVAKDADTYVINGQKAFCSRVKESQILMLVTRTTPYEQAEKRTQGITLFFTDLNWDSGALEAHEMHKMGRNAVPTYQFFMDDWQIPAADICGDVGRGFYYLIDTLNPERIAVAAQAVGLGHTCVSRAVEYAKERVVFGRPIGQNQAIQFPLAEAYSRLEAARLMTYKAAWLFDRGEPCGAESNMAKVLASDAAFFAADRAVQTHGGYGYVREFDVERYFRELRLLQIAPVSQEMAYNHLAQHVLGLPRSY